MKAEPLVSIITPTYNSSQFIADTIKSVINQTYKNWELIIIDDASSDTTISIIETYNKSESKIKLIQNKVNQGAGITRNIGIDEAKGDFIAFLDGDDLWRPNKLKLQIAFMRLHKADICFSSYDLINETGEFLNKTVKALPKLTYKKCLTCNYIGNLTGIYNVKTLGKIYAPILRKRQDWLLWLRAIKKSGKPALGIEESLAVYRLRDESISSNKLNLLKYNYWVYRKGLGFSIVKSTYYLLIIFMYEYFFLKPKQTITSKRM